MWLSGSYAEEVLKAARVWQEAKDAVLLAWEPNLMINEMQRDAQLAFFEAETRLLAAVTKHRSIDFRDDD